MTFKNSAKGNFVRAAFQFQFPSSKPWRPHFRGRKHQGRNVACLFRHLSELAVPKKGLDTLLCAVWVLNKYLLAASPTQM
jgi:hypothetical protein